MNEETIVKAIYLKYFTLTLTLFAFATLLAQPANDPCTGAQSVTPNGSCVSGTTVGAADNWSSTVGCQSGSPNNHPEVWYTFVSTGTSYVGTVTGSGSWAGNVEFTLVSGTCAGGFTVVGSACGASPLSVSISGLSSGTTYYFTVSNNPSGTTGPFQVCSNTPAAACTSGQSCNTPTVVTYTTGVQTCLSGCNTGAPAGPNFTGSNCYDFPNATVWYQITTGASSASLNIAITSATLTNPYFTVFTTPNCALYTIVNCTQGSGGTASANVTVRTNTTYLIAISNANATQGNFNVCFTVNDDNSVCNQTDQLSVTATSMGSPLSGPYQPGEQVTFCYTITNFQTTTATNCNYLEGIVPTFGNCWDPVSFTAQGQPVNITSPLATAGVIQPCPPGPPCAWNACVGASAGTWSWFPAGSVNYNNINNPNIPNGTALGAGWFFLSSYDPVTGNCAPDPTDPDNSFGDSHFASCLTTTLDWQVCFRLQARAAIACTNGQTDCSVSVKTYADGEVGAWNSTGCTADLPAVFPANLYCCTPPVVSASNTGPYCAGATIQLNATGGTSYSWSGPAGYTSAVQNPTRATSTIAMSGTYTVTVTDASGCTATATTAIVVNANPTVAPTAAPAVICNNGSTALAANATAGSGTISTYAWSSGLAGNVSGGSVSPVANTTYTVTVTNSNSCTTTASIAVTVSATPTASPTATLSVICNGGSTTLAANATAGSGTISTYAWSSGLAGNVSGGSVSPIANTTYTVTVTNSNSCTATASVAVTVNARPTVAPSATPTIICNGGSATLASNATAGSGTISTYAWSSGLAGSVSGGSVSPTTNTTYTVTVTNSNSCTATGSVAVTVNANPTVAPSANPSVICNGGSTTLAANATAGSGTISSYAWSSGLAGNVSGGSVSPTTNTTYTVTVTNSNSCTATASVAVTVNARPTAAPSATLSIICNGGTASLAANATAGSGTISTYAWSSGLAGNVSGGPVSPATNTTYTVTVTNSNSCTATASVAVTVNVRPTVAPTATPTVICNGGSTTLAANATAGSGSISTYAWSSGLAGNVSGGTVSPVANTTYTVTVTNSNSCTGTASIAVTVNSPPTASPTATPAVICNGGSTTLAANATAGSGTISTYAWSSGLAGNVSGGSASPVANTTYTVTVTNSNSCTVTASVAVTVNARPTVAPNAIPTIICNGGSTTLAANASAGSGTISTYAWSSGLAGSVSGGSVSPTANTTYTVTVTNSNSCTATGSIAVTVNANPTVAPSATPSAICNGGSTTLAANATAGSGTISTYAWSSGLAGNVSGGSVSPTTNTTYTVTVTNSNSCTTTASVAITVNALPAVAPTATTAVICDGGSTTLAANATAGSGTISTYAWSSGLAGNISGGPVSPTTNTTYTVTVTNSNSCTATASVAVTVNARPAVAPTATPTVICNGESTTLAANATAGSGTISTYAWSSGLAGNVSGGTVSPVANTTYTITVTNSNSCTATATIAVTVSMPPTVSPTATTSAICNGGSTTLAANASAGSGTISNYAWSSGLAGNVSGGTVSPTTNTTYTVTVTNSNSCTATASVTITVTAIPTVVPSVTPMIICNGGSTTLAANASAGSGTISTYAWSSGLAGSVSGGTVSPVTNTAYTVTVTNSNSCTATGSVAVTVNANPTVAPSANPSIICNGGSTTIAANATAGSGAISTYTWSSGLAGNVSGGSVSPTTNTTYTVTVTNSNSCTATASVAVTVNAVPSVAPNATTAVICNGGNTTLAANATAGSGTISIYAWSSGLAGNVSDGPVSPTTNTTYTVTVTNSNSCTATASVAVTVNARPTVVPTATPAVICNGGSTTLAANATAGSGSISTYAWSSGLAGNVSGGSVSPVANTTYTVTVTNSNSCTATATISVTVNTLPIPTATNTGAYCEGATIQLNSSGGNVYSWSGPGAFSSSAQNPQRTGATIAMSGNYDVTVTGANGCTATASTNVIVNATPAASASNTGPYCTTSTIQLYSGGGNSYSWSGPSAFASPIQNPTRTNATLSMAGIYIVTVTDANSCTATASTNVVINSSLTPIASNAGPFCVNGTIQLNVAGGNFYSWSGPSSFASNTQNATIISATNSMSGIYYVTATDLNGCSGTASTNVIVNTLPIATASNTGPFCVNSTIQLNSFGGNTFSWSGVSGFVSASQNPTRSNSTTAMSGTYTVTVTDINSCSATASTNVIVISASVANAGPDAVITCSTQQPSLNAAAIGAGETYLWSGPGIISGGNTASPIVNANGTYTLVVTDVNNCTASDQAAVSSDTAPPNTTAGPDATLTCVITSITLTASSTTSGATFLWSNGTSTANNTVSIANTYTVTVTDPSNGCTASDQAIVNSNTTIPNVNGGADATLTCSITSVTLSASSITPGATFAWSNGINTANNSVSVANTYTVTVTDPNNGCTASDQAVINSNTTVPNANAGPDATLTCTIVSVTLTASSTTPGATFAWSNGTNTANNSVSIASTYTVTVTDPNNGCTASDQAVVNSNTTIPNANAGPDATLTCASTSVTLSASSTTTGATFAWSNGTNTSNNSVSVANTYTVTVTDPANGCTASDQVVVASSLSLPDVSAGSDETLTCTVTSITLIASSTTPGVTFAWSNGINVASNPVSIANTYTVTVTNPTTGCAASDQVIVSSNIVLPDANAGPDAMLTCSVTSVTISASSTTPGATFAWSNGINTANNSVSVANTYTVTVTDPNNGCTASDQGVVNSNTAVPNANAGTDATLTCTIVSVTLTASSTTPGATFAWSNGTSTATNSVSVANTYTVTATDPNNGCTASDQTVVNSNTTVPNANAGPDATLTCTIGSVTLTASSTTPGATFAWSNGTNTANNSVSIASPYTVTVTDPNNGCTASDQAVVNSNTTIPNANAGPDATLTCASTSVTLSASSTTTGATFAWSNGTNTANNSVSVANTYTVTVTDPANGCTASDQVVVASSLGLPDVSAGADETLTCTVTSVTLVATSTTPGVTFAWSNGINVASNPVSIANTYTVTVTNPTTGCAASDQVIVSSNIVLPDANAGPDAMLTCSIVATTLMASSTTAGATFSWSNGTSTANNTVSIANTYTVTVTDPLNGCTASDQALVNSNTTMPNVNGGADATLTCSVTSVTLSASSTTPGATFAWSNGINTANNSVSVANTYTITVTDPNNGCTVSDLAVVNSNTSIPNANAGPDTTLTCTTTSVTITASSITPGAIYMWSNGTSTANNIVNVANSYTVTITDPFNGCTASDQAVVFTSSNLPNINAGADATLTCAVTSVTLIATSTTPGVTFAWSNGVNVANNPVSIGNTYTVTATNTSTGCAASDQVVVLSNTVHPNVSAGPDAMLTCVVTSATLTASSTTAGATFIWSNGTSTANNSVTIVNTYTVTATDPVNGCSASDQAVLNSNTVIPNANAGADVTLTCAITSLTLTGISSTSGATFLWSNGTNTANNSVNIANTYTVTTTDPSNGCTASDQVIVSSNTVAPNVSVGPDATLTCVITSVTLTANSTTPGAAFLWNNGISTAAISVNVANTYTVTVTDPNNGCTASASSSALQNIILPDVNISPPADLTCLVTSVTLVASSSTNGVSYDWGSGIFTSTRIVNITGTYSVTVTDPANNCSASTSTTVNQNIAIPNVSISPPATLTCSVTSVSLTASSSILGATYAWSGGGTGSTKTVNNAGSYFVTVTDPANGCTAYTSVAVNSLSNLVLSVNETDILCNGAGTGSIDLTINGGAQPYTIQWDNGSTNEDLLGITAGNYIVTVTDNAGCVATSSSNLTEPPAFSVSAIRNNVLCNGGNLGSVIISPSGGTSPYTYIWNDGNLSQNRNFLSAGTYSLTVNDNNSCTFSISMQITQPAALSVIETHTDVQCNGENTGSINLTANGGTLPYTYLWNDGITSPIRNNITAANYSVIITDSNSCSTSLTVPISEPAALSISETHTDIPCNGANTGSINIISSGGTTPHTFIWNDGNLSPIRNNIAAGNYSITTTDNNLCSVSANVIITEPPALIVSETHANILCNGASTGVINISASGGTAPITFSWNDGNTSAIRNNIFAGNYSVTVNDNNSCSTSINIAITEPPALTISETHMNVACSGGTGSIDITSGGGVSPLIYLWNDGTIAEDRTGLVPANYSVTVSDNNSCSSSINIVISSNAGILIAETHNDVSCFGGNNANINVNVSGGVSPYTYLWSDGAFTSNRTNVSAGNYTLSVNDNNSCIQILNVTITEPPALSILMSSTNALCNGGNTGSVSLTSSGGTMPYAFIWNDGAATEDRINLTAGNYAVTINDNNSCSSSLIVNIGEPSALNLSETHTDALCNDGSTGSITLTVSGGTIPYSFTWNDGVAVQDRINLTSGSYSVTVLDNNSCPATQNIIITEPSAMAVAETHTNETCNGGNNAAISINVSGGTSPYTFIWSDGATSQDRINLSTGNYSITVNDNNSCSSVLTGIIITEPAAISLTEVSTNVSCNGYADGNITLTVTGGTAPYTFIWGDGAASQNRNNLSAGNYSVTVNDSQACTGSANAVITEPTAAMLETSLLNPSCESINNNGNITLNVSGGSAPYQYSWSNGASGSIVSNVGPGNYSVTISDANGCVMDSSFALIYQYDFSIEATPSVTIAWGESTTLGFTLTGNAGNYVTVWTPSSTLSCSDCAAPDATPNSTTTYQIYVINDVGCSATDDVTIYVENDHTIFVPNVFTPNGDGNNDVFEVYGKLKSIAYLEMQIFNRWGEKVFGSNDHYFTWDGSHKGIIQNPQVFIWELKLTWIDGKREELRKGSVTLLK